MINFVMKWFKNWCSHDWSVADAAYGESVDVYYQLIECRKCKKVKGKKYSNYEMSTISSTDCIHRIAAIKGYYKAKDVLK